ncbi:PQQ-binding-like beta-propeller repeat protein [Streptomyces ochraceiscleroticus]|uniref:PQQ-binding-like beta-propeller repeat protein n=1 Tax=Streptomyces ochraceiscleroticus TaxID=47761 RepID=A0ABW1MWP9_9ACTN|nr:PQQ-binding-like beta-propeller repeat protein [Streptomyces ochraceiscleroticus]
MTQPPQPPPPPGQPPSGGFGAPQDPSYGYPQQPGRPPQPEQPPNQPPQAPPQPPQAPPQPQQAPDQPPQGPPPPPGPYGAQPAYGYPAQGPGYGYPQQPGQPGQPGAPGPYGAPYPPGAQFPGGMPPQGGGGNQQRTRIMIVVAAVVAIALIVGGGVWFANSGGGDDPAPNAQGSSEGTSGGKGGDAPTSLKGGKVALNAEAKPGSSTGKLLFNVPLPSPDKSVVTLNGAWATAKTYAKVSKGEIVGYDVDARKPKYKLPMDGIICGASNYATEEGKAAVVFEAGPRKGENDREPCSQMALLDIDSGKFDWQKTMPGGEQASSIGMGVTFSQGAVVASWPGNGEAAYDISGKELWHQRDNGNDASMQCLDRGIGGGKKLVAVVRCGEYGSQTTQIQEIDPATGKPKWTYDAPKGVKSAEVVSTNGPVVVGISAGESGITDMVVIDDSGKRQAQISLQDDKYKPNCGITGGVERCVTATADDKYLYMPSKSHDAVGGESFDNQNEIVAFDLKTGSATWKASSEVNQELVPIRMAGDQLIAYQDGYSDKGGQVVSIDPAQQGKKTVFLNLPKQTADAARSLRPGMTRAVYEHGRLFLNQDIMSGTKYGLGDGKYLGLAFGS